MSEYHTSKMISDETRKPPVKPHNADVRPREYLFVEEVARLLDASREGRYGDRNYALILLMYRHALRASEAADLQWDHINFKAGTILVQRAKGGTPGTHYLERDELLALKKLGSQTGYVFKSSRQPCLSERAIHRIVAESGEAAKFTFPIHPHMLRHSKGYQLGNSGTDTRLIQGYMGHKSITNTVKYTELAANRFKGLGKGDLA